MFKLIDNFLNKITMYRLVMYFVFILWAIALVFSFFGILPFQPLWMALSALLIIAVCWVTNQAFAALFKAPVNAESFYITAFILMVVLTPVASADALSYWAFLALVSALAIASKFILAIGKKHIFNPAAFGLAAGALAMSAYGGAWWLGTAAMLPFVLVGGFLVARKIKRWDLVLSFIVAAFASVAVTTWARGFDPLAAVQRSLIDSPIFFFAFIMITEPITTPPARAMRVVYGALVGALFAPAVHIGSIHSTPELVLLVGNMFSYIVSPKAKLMLALKEKKQIGPDLYDLSFTADRPLKFKPGQYLEWTLGHEHPDTRGNRRYFTIASSPTESEIHMGVKFYPQASSFKKTLLDLKPGDKIVASQLAGEFTLPSDPAQKLAFIAGGIGVTPFRSIIKNLIDTNDHRDAVLFYSARNPTELVYKEIFDQAAAYGLRTEYIVHDTTPEWPGKTGYITPELIMAAAPDYKERMFYISGPHAMVTIFKAALKNLGVPRGHIKVDYFPGFV